MPSSLELPGEVFEDGSGHSAGGRTPETSFTDFVQYQEDGERPQPNGTDPATSPLDPPSATPRPQVRSGAALSKPQDSRPVMQCCLEQFQHFLSRLITLYITSPSAAGNSNHNGSATELERPAPRRPKMEMLKVGPVGGVVMATTRREEEEEEEAEACGRRECLAAFTAACQLFLECSSFPVYIAEGNLKATPSREELAGEETHLSHGYTCVRCCVISPKHFTSLGAVLLYSLGFRCTHSRSS